MAEITWAAAAAASPRAGTVTHDSHPRQRFVLVKKKQQQKHRAPGKLHTERSHYKKEKKGQQQKRTNERTENTANAFTHCARKRRQTRGAARHGHKEIEGPKARSWCHRQQRKHMERDSTEKNITRRSSERGRRGRGAGKRAAEKSSSTSIRKHTEEGRYERRSSRAAAAWIRHGATTKRETEREARTRKQRKAERVGERGKKNTHTFETDEETRRGKSNTKKGWGGGGGQKWAMESRSSTGTRVRNKSWR